MLTLNIPYLILYFPIIWHWQMSHNMFACIVGRSSALPMSMKGKSYHYSDGRTRRKVYKERANRAGFSLEHRLLTYLLTWWPLQSLTSNQSSDWNSSFDFTCNFVYDQIYSVIWRYSEHRIIKCVEVWWVGKRPARASMETWMLKQ